MSTVSTRLAGPQDVPLLYRIARSAFAELAAATPRSAVLDDTEADVAADLAAGFAIVVEADGVPVAAVRAVPEGPGRLLRVRRVSVAPSARGRGLAGVLLTSVAEVAARQGFSALRANVRQALPHNHRIYDSLGWLPVHEDADWRTYGLALPRAVPDAPTMRGYGRALADLLVAGDVVVLAGPLGAGKTVLAQGIGAGLGVTDRITSPTFVLAREHASGRLPLVHVDAYRLGSLRELDDLDLDTAAGAAVTLVEWGSGLAEVLADGHLEARIARSDDPGDETRRLTLRGVGPRWAGRRGALDALEPRP